MYCPERRTLDNGLTINNIPTTIKKLFRIELIIKKGSLIEQEDEIGYSHFIEHLMSFYPSQKFKNSLKNQKDINNLGISVNAWTEPNTVGYFMEGLYKHKNKIIEYILYNLLCPIIDDNVFDNEKNAVIKELENMKSDPWNNLESMINYVKFNLTNLAFTIEKEIDNIKKLKKSNKTTQQIIKFINDNCRDPNSIIINIISGYSIDEIFKDIPSDIKHSLNSLNGNNTINKYPKEVNKKNKFGEYNLFYIKPANETDLYKIEIHFDINFDEFDDRKYCLEFINVILSNGLSSKLYIKLRSELGAVYNVKTSCFLDPINPKMSVFIIDTETDDEYLETVLNVLLEEIEKLKNFKSNNYFSNEEWTRYCNTIHTTHAKDINIEYFTKYYDQYKDSLIWNKPLVTIEEEMKKELSVTNNELSKVINNIFKPKNMKIFYSGEKCILKNTPKLKHKIIKYNEIKKLN